MDFLFSGFFIIAIVVLLLVFLHSFTRDPYAYGNIAMMSVIILLVALVAGSFTMARIETREGGISLVWTMASFLWEFSRSLFIPLCFMCLFLCISNVALLRREGFRLNNFLGFIFSGLYLTFINIMWFPINSLPRIMNAPIIFGRLMLCYMECTVLAICLIGFAVQWVKPRYDRDFIIILGCSVSKKGKLRPLLKGRVNRAMRYVWEQEWKAEKSSLYVPSGGKGSDEPISEGGAMEMYLLSHGAEDNEVLAEKESRNTYENIKYSKKIIDEHKKGASVAVVTTNYHALRSGMLARYRWPDAIVIPSSTKWYFWPNAFFREIVAILVMSLPVHIAVAVLSALVSVMII